MELGNSSTLNSAGQQCSEPMTKTQRNVESRGGVGVNSENIWAGCGA